MSYKQMTGNLISATKLVPTANSSSAYGVASGVWNLNDMYDYKRGGQWPIPAGVPGAPTISGVTAGNTQVDVAFSANADTGGLTVTSFTATASSGQTASGSSSPLTVTSLTNGNAITFTVTATNAAGTSAASSASSSVTPVNPPRALFFGGGTNKYYNSEVDTIDYITISSTGNASDFGDLTTARSWLSGCSSTTRAIAMGGSQDGNGTKSNIIDYVTMASTGNATDFGDLSAARYGTGALSSATRGVCAGGDVDGVTSTDIMDYVTIGSTGNATDFGNLTTARNSGPAGCASPTRGLFAGGLNNAGSGSDAIDYITIASTGNASDFGDLNVTVQASAGLSNETRGVFGRFYSGGGQSSPINNMDYVTIASTGNATDFGNLAAVTGGGAGTASQVRGVFGTGADGGDTALNVMEYITIATTGDTTDFGDLTVARTRGGAGSTDHGGLQ